MICERDENDVYFETLVDGGEVAASVAGHRRRLDSRDDHGNLADDVFERRHGRSLGRETREGAIRTRLFAVEFGQKTKRRIEESFQRYEHKVIIFNFVSDMYLKL